MYDRLKKFSKSKISNLISFFWGFTEGIFFFIVPDVYIGFTSLFNFKSGIVSMVFALFGSLLSAVFVYFLQSVLGNQTSSLLLYIPGIKDNMLTKVSTELATQGLSALVSGPVIGIPYKVYTTLAAQLKFPLVEYLIWSIPSRLERMVLVFIVGAGVGNFFRKTLAKHPSFSLFCYILLWVGIYAVYFVLINAQVK